MIRGIIESGRKESPMDFRPLEETERLRLVAALRGNAEDGRALLIDPRAPSFPGGAAPLPLSPRATPRSPASPPTSPARGSRRAARPPATTDRPGLPTP